MERTNSYQNNTAYQKGYIISNSKFLSEKNKLHIIDCIKEAVNGYTFNGKKIFLDSTSKAKAVHIDLDVLEEASKGTITTIYTIVKNRRDSLNNPVKPSIF